MKEKKKDKIRTRTRRGSRLKEMEKKRLEIGK